MLYVFLHNRFPLYSGFPLAMQLQENSLIVEFIPPLHISENQN